MSGFVEWVAYLNMMTNGQLLIAVQFISGSLIVYGVIWGLPYLFYKQNKGTIQDRPQNSKRIRKLNISYKRMRRHKK